ncbi:hypothetical protein D7X55_01545 [Corallococcus sp. AB049A]|uniref:Malectin domain-containing protein n=1 Tax=Corallococcus interemptor TaxID=2316720 RepID=A0A3A8QXP6_9BACT|nr:MULTISPECIES: hypothetical protein [Corallococcus]RKH53851.1 hypothetical protein D7Y23_02270 [Corallococcus sp. AB050B]RKH71215.1 hypothetical protein D7X96_09235 [Corallococcus interemptor]RKI74763.1 hypothetical protein D7X55_01545 [Corallococcus sp. AB049A]
MKKFLLSAAATLGLTLASSPAHAQSPGPFSPFAPFELRVNFQPANAPVPAGFVADSGQVYGNRGNGFTYGWNQDNTANTRDRNNPNTPSQAYDTLIRTQNGANYTWELAVPNGYYEVRLVAGDSDFIDSEYAFSVEYYGDVLRGTPTADQHFFEAVKLVDVSDGRLTVRSSSPAVNNKLAFLEVKRKFGIDINFQPASNPPLENFGYLPDNGLVYGARQFGFTYGWNVDNTANMVDAGHDVDIVAQRHARMQQGGDRVWEIAVPNGVYEVSMLAGEPFNYVGAYRIQAEDTVVLSGMPTGYGFTTGIARVAVSDGRLTVKSAPGAGNNRINAVYIRQQ